MFETKCQKYESLPEIMVDGKHSFVFLEHCHNYIQWLFPLNEQSTFNVDAPILTEEDIALFSNSFFLKHRLYESFQMMINFYGFEMDFDNKIVLSVDWAANHWLKPNDHNFLRITRILKSLTLLGLKEVADSFLEALKSLKQECLFPINKLSNNTILTPKVWDFWESAVEVNYEK